MACFFLGISPIHPLNLSRSPEYPRTTIPGMEPPSTRKTEQITPLDCVEAVFHGGPHLSASHLSLSISPELTAAPELHVWSSAPPLELLHRPCRWSSVRQPPRPASGAPPSAASPRRSSFAALEPAAGGEALRGSGRRRRGRREGGRGARGGELEAGRALPGAMACSARPHAACSADEGLTAARMDRHCSPAAGSK